jgi:hypothetical protein
VDISTNAVTWIDLGDVLGQPTSIDIDSIANEDCLTTSHTFPGNRIFRIKSIRRSPIDLSMDSVRNSLGRRVQGKEQ